MCPKSLKRLKVPMAQGQAAMAAARYPTKEKLRLLRSGDGKRIYS